MKTLLSVWNDKHAPMTIFIEPWGRDYTLLPDERYDIRVKINFGGTIWPSLICHENGDMQIYIEGRHKNLRLGVYDGQTLLECGHNRRPE
jgi:hypothetical protein